MRAGVARESRRSGGAARGLAAECGSVGTFVRQDNFALTRGTCARIALRMSLPIPILFGHAEAQQRSGVSPGSLQISSWSVSDTLSGIAPGQSIRSPFLAHHGDTIYVVANLFPINARAGLLARPATLVRIPGGPVTLPSGTFGFGFPKGVVDRTGTYHLFWSESTEPQSSRRWRIPTASSLWHAELRRGMWSRPERLLTGTLLRWTPDQGRPIIDNAGRVHLLITASLDGLHDSSIHIRQVGSHWQIRRLKPDAIYAALVPWHGDTLVAAFVAADRLLSSGSSNVFVETSTDGGARWSKPRLLESGSSTSVATSPALVRDPHAVHLLWAYNAVGRASPGVLRHELTMDAGLTWQHGGDATLLRAGTLDFAAVTSGCGTTVALVESIAAAGGAATVVVDEISWGVMSPPARQLFPTYASIASPGVIEMGGTLHLVASAVRVHGSPAIAIHASRAVCLQ